MDDWLAEYNAWVEILDKQDAEKHSAGVSARADALVKDMGITRKGSDLLNRP